MRPMPLFPPFGPLPPPGSNLIEALACPPYPLCRSCDFEHSNFLHTEILPHKLLLTEASPWCFPSTARLGLRLTADWFVRDWGEKATELQLAIFEKDDGIREILCGLHRHCWRRVDWHLNSLEVQGPCSVPEEVTLMGAAALNCNAIANFFIPKALVVNFPQSTSPMGISQGSILYMVSAMWVRPVHHMKVPNLIHLPNFQNMRKPFRSFCIYVFQGKCPESSASNLKLGNLSTP